MLTIVKWPRWPQAMGLAMLPLLLGSCASILNSNKHSLVLESEPHGAAVHVNGNQKGTTPFEYAYHPDDGEEVRIEFRHPGYKPTTLIIRPRENSGVLFVDAMLLGIPYIFDKNNPDLYVIPVKSHKVQLYKEHREDLSHFSIPLAGIDLDLGDRPDLGTYRSKKITMTKDGLFRELTYVENFTGAVTTALKDSWIETRTVRLGTSKGDEAVQRSKVYMRPLIRGVHGDLYGKKERCFGSLDIEIDWKFMSGTIKDSVLFTFTTKSTYYATGTNSRELLYEAMAHSARRLTEDPDLHEKVSSAYGASLIHAKGAAVNIPRPSPIAYNGRKEMLSALVKAVVTIQTEKGHGSGFLVSNDGYMITNEHVVGNEALVKVKFEQGFTLDGQVLKTNKDFDLALVKVAASDMPALTIGNDEGLMLGEEIFAIGTPLDQSLGQSVTRGILSGRRDLDGFQFLQTDVSINPGNSGGPLLDEEGKVVGVATMKISGKGLEGLGFGVPITKALEMLNLTIE